MTWRERYKQSYDKWQLKQYPAASRDFGTLEPNYPKVATSNGLTRFIVNFLKYEGWRATRINVSGRLIEQPEKQASGVILGTKKWMHSTTRKGTADISATIKGRSIMIEVKAGKDKPRESQLAEQARERAAGGIYEFIYTPDEFLELYDKILSL